MRVQAFAPSATASSAEADSAKTAGEKIVAANTACRLVAISAVSCAGLQPPLAAPELLAEALQRTDRRGDPRAVQHRTAPELARTA